MVRAISRKVVRIKNGHSLEAFARLFTSVIPLNDDNRRDFRFGEDFIYEREDTCVRILDRINIAIVMVELLWKKITRFTKDVGMMGNF